MKDDISFCAFDRNKIPHRATIKDLCLWYNVSYPTMKKWLSLIPNLGGPKFGIAGFSREQIEMIFSHLEFPF